METKTKHTPGPWKIMQCLPREPRYKGETETVIVDQDNRNILNRDVCEEAANARLIAAAPILLEACKQIESELVEGQNVPSLKAMEMIHRAICRAEGSTDSE